MEPWSKDGALVGTITSRARRGGMAFTEYKHCWPGKGFSLYLYRPEQFCPTIKPACTPRTPPFVRLNCTQVETRLYMYSWDLPPPSPVIGDRIVYYSFIDGLASFSDMNSGAKFLNVLFPFRTLIIPRQDSEYSHVVFPNGRFPPQEMFFHCLPWGKTAASYTYVYWRSPPTLLILDDVRGLDQ
jgi:hypothetical protein